LKTSPSLVSDSKPDTLRGALEQAFDEAVELVMRKLSVLAEEGWT
jgi:hypothetical protein